MNRDSGTVSANGGWLRRLVRHHRRDFLKADIKNHKATITFKTPMTIYPATTDQNSPESSCLETYLVLNLEIFKISPEWKPSKTK
jgi:hypothetical protein